VLSSDPLSLFKQKHSRQTFAVSKSVKILDEAPGMQQPDTEYESEQQRNLAVLDCLQFNTTVMRTDNLWRGMGGLDDNDPDAHLFLPLSTQ
jgi:hypothetical protein